MMELVRTLVLIHIADLLGLSDGWVICFYSLVVLECLLNLLSGSSKKKEVSDASSN